MAKLPKPVYRFNVIPIKLPMTFLKELEQIILKFKWNHKKKKKLSENPRKNYKAETTTLTDFKQYYKVTIIKTTYYWDKNGHASTEQI